MDLYRKIATITAALLALLALTAPCSAGPIWDWLCGRAPNMTAQTIYVPPYVGEVPAACGTCTPQICQYIPYTSYRTVYRPVPVPACQPVPGCNPYIGCPVTTYRPVVLWTRPARLIPYTTYRMVHSPVATVGYTGVCAAPCVRPVFPPAPTYGVPSTSCPSSAPIVAAPAPSTYYGPSPSTVPSTPIPTFETTPSTAADNAGTVSGNSVQKSIYEQKQPAGDLGPSLPENPSPANSKGDQLLPIPKTDTQYNSVPVPPAPDAKDRLTSKPRPGLIRHVALPVQAPPKPTGDWLPGPG